MPRKPARWLREIARIVGKGHTHNVLSSTPYPSSWPKTWTWLNDPWVLLDINGRGYALGTHGAVARVLVRLGTDQRPFSEEGRRLLCLPEGELTRDVVESDATWAQLHDWERGRFVELTRVYEAMRHNQPLSSVASLRAIAQQLSAYSTASVAAAQIKATLARPALDWLKEFTQ
jgi:hypothetical protein